MNRVNLSFIFLLIVAIISGCSSSYLKDSATAGKSYEVVYLIRTD